MLRKTPLQRKTPLVRMVRLKRSPKPQKSNPTGFEPMGDPIVVGGQLQLSGESNLQYYHQGIAISTWVCENCGDYIPHGQAWQQFAAQCHILDKEKYDSVRNHPQNRLHQCARCHMDWDSSWLKASGMKIFPLALTRLKTFVHLVQEPLPEIFVSVKPG